MAQTATQITKKQAQPVRRPRIEKPQRDLTPAKEEIADLASALIMNGGSRQDLDLLVKALLQHQYKKYRRVHNEDANLDEVAEEYARRHSDRSARPLVKQWPDPFEIPSDDESRPTATTVTEMARANVRRELRDQFEDFFTDSREGLEPLWMLNEILEYCTSGGYDLAKGKEYDSQDSATRNAHAQDN